MRAATRLTQVAVLLLPLALTIWPARSVQAASNPIQLENTLVGTTAWRITHPATGGQIEGYASTTSAAGGDTVGFFVRTTAPAFDAIIYRMGWYGGAGARVVDALPSMPGHPYQVPAPDLVTGLVTCHWPAAFSLIVPFNWTSGVYLVKLTASSGFESYIPLVIRDDRPSDVLFVHAVATDEAYNSWGGASLYGGSGYTTREAQGAHRAVKVSFDRPFAQGYGSGMFLAWEYDMVRWLERSGYDVAYATDVDVHEHPELLLHHRAVIIAGHDEYWSLQMRNAYESAVNAGVDLGVFAANTGYWQIRLEPDGDVPDRVIACYKYPLSADPAVGVDNAVVTGRWRSPPVDRPESALLGASYGFETYQGAGYPWVFAAGPAWLLQGTGLSAGASVPGLVGYEYDQVSNRFPLPPNLSVVAASPVMTVSGTSDIANSTLYTAFSGARVFNAGTVQWSWGLDDYSASAFSAHHVASEVAQAITANVLTNFLSVPSVPLPTVNAAVTGSLGSNGWYTSPPTLTLLASSAGASIQYSLNGGRAWQAYAAPVLITDQGTTTVMFRATTQQGLNGPSGTMLVNEDSVAPHTTLVLSGQLLGNGYYESPVSVTFTAEDAASGVQQTLYSVDGGSHWETYTSPVRVSTAGHTRILYYSTDRAGNVETVEHADISVASPPPTVSALVDGNLVKALWYAHAVQIAFEPAQATGVQVQSIVYSLDDGTTWQPYMAPFLVTQSGIVTILYRATDMAGQTGPEAELILHMDMQPVTVDLGYQRTRATYNRSVVVQAHIGAGISLIRPDSIAVTLDGRKQTSQDVWKGPQQVTVSLVVNTRTLGFGSHELRVTATNGAGQTGNAECTISVTTSPSAVLHDMRKLFQHHRIITERAYRTLLGDMHRVEHMMRLRDTQGAHRGLAGMVAFIQANETAFAPRALHVLRAELQYLLGTQASP